MSENGSRPEMPEGWEWKTMGEIAEVVGGSTPNSKEQSYWGGEIPWLAVSDLTDYSDKYITRGARSITRAGFESCATQMLPKGAVVFSSRAPIGYVAIADTRLCTSQGFKSFVLRDGVDPEYVYWYLRSAKSLAESLASGTTFKELSGKRASTIPIPVPPPDEQSHIVRWVEELVGGISAGDERLDATAAALQVMRRSSLREAFSISGRSDPTTNGEADSPGRVALADVCQTITDCEHKTAPADPDGEAFSIGTGSLRDGRMLLDRAKQVSDETHVAWSRRATLRARDLVLAREAPVGEVGMVPPGIKACLGQRTVLIRPEEAEIVAEYLLFLLQSPEVRAEMTRLSGGSTVAHLNVRDIRTLAIPVPPSLEEQRRVVVGLDERRREIEAALNTMEGLKRQSERLRRSVLGAAFTGRRRAKIGGHPARAA